MQIPVFQLAYTGPDMTVHSNAVARIGDVRIDPIDGAASVSLYFYDSEAAAAAKAAPIFEERFLLAGANYAAIQALFGPIATALFPMIQAMPNSPVAAATIGTATV